MPKRMTVREAIREVEADGWRMQKRKGMGHRQFTHPTKPGKVTISGNPGEQIDAGTWASIRRQASI